MPPVQAAPGSGVRGPCRCAFRNSGTPGSSALSSFGCLTHAGDAQHTIDGPGGRSGGLGFVLLVHNDHGGHRDGQGNDEHGGGCVGPRGLPPLLALTRPGATAATGGAQGLGRPATGPFSPAADAADPFPWRTVGLFSDVTPGLPDTPDANARTAVNRLAGDAFPAAPLLIVAGTALTALTLAGSMRAPLPRASGRRGLPAARALDGAAVTVAIATRSDPVLRRPQ